MNEKFQIFGSKSSQDIDVMFFVDKIPSPPDKAHDLCKIYNEKIAKLYNTDREINSNLAILKDGMIVHTHKGTEDEVNNSLFHTYGLHDQRHPLQIMKLYDRDVELKIHRTLRVLLSMISRTEHRSIVKKALRSDVHEKIRVLDSIDYSKITTLGKKNENFEDYLKVMAFQLGQTLALTDIIDPRELYTKEDIINSYPIFKNHLMRLSYPNLDYIEAGKSVLLMQISKFDFKETSEYDYREKHLT